MLRIPARAAVEPYSQKAQLRTQRDDRNQSGLRTSALAVSLFVLSSAVACGEDDDGGDGGTGGKGVSGASGTPSGGTSGAAGTASGGASSGTAGGGGEAGGGEAGDGGTGAGGTRGGTGSSGMAGEGGLGGAGGEENGGTGGTAGVGGGGTAGVGGGGTAGVGGGGTAGGGAGGSGAGAGGAGAGGAGAGGAGAGGANAGSGGMAAGAGGSGGAPCTPAPLSCIRVSPSGNDATAVSTCATTPFRDVQPAIEYAHTHRGVSTNVCVAGGNDCNGATSFVGDLTMRNGISVYGSYESNGWTRCSFLTTELRPSLAAGIRFGSDVVSTTELDGFTIAHPQLTATVGVTVDGARNVELTDLELVGPGSPVDRRGIDITNGARVTLDGISIPASGSGGATGFAFGVRAVASELTLLHADFDLRIGQNGTGYGVWLEDVEDAVVSDSAIDVSAPLGTATGVELETSPGADLDAMVTASGALSTGVHLGGDAAGTLLDGEVTATGPAAVGILADACDGAEPEIRADVGYSSTAGGSIEGIHVFGDCHPLVTGGTVSGVGLNVTSMIGVRCGAASGVASGCTIRGSTIRTELSRTLLGPNSRAVGVSCEAGACDEISQSDIAGPTQAGSSCLRSCDTTALGIVLGATDALIARNLVTGGCADRAAAIHSTSSSSRIENNRLFGGSCASSGLDNYVYSAGIFVQGGTLDVHSNTIDAGGSPNVVTSCTSDAVMGGSGLYRNNIFLSGQCPVRAGFAERTGEVPGSIGAPMALQNNAFASPGVLYAPATPPDLTTIASVNALPYASVGGNIAVAPAFVAYPTDLHLLAESLCIDSGTPTGAPANDMDGLPRSATKPDIGADEWGDLPDPCLGQTCSGYGTCVPAGRNASCNCSPGYENPPGNPLACVPIVTPCQPNPCQNGGTCTPNGANYSCSCPQGINGATCGITFTSLAAGRDQTCGLRSDGKIACWGDNSLGAATAPPGSSFTSISAGALHSCATRTAQSAVCWGYPSGATTDIPSSVFESLGIGDDHGCGVRADNDLVECWGAESGGQTLEPSGTFLSVATIGFYSCGIRTNGNVECWGLDPPDHIFDVGQATPLTGTFQSLSLNFSQACGLRTNGNIACWGQNTFANGETPPGGTFMALAIASDFGCAIGTNGALDCWGANQYGQSTPPTGTFDALTVSTGPSYHACAIRSDKVVLCWGMDHGLPPTGQP